MQKHLKLIKTITWSSCSYVQVIPTHREQYIREGDSEISFSLIDHISKEEIREKDDMRESRRIDIKEREDKIE